LKPDEICEKNEYTHPQTQDLTSAKQELTKIDASKYASEFGESLIDGIGGSLKLKDLPALLELCKEIERRNQNHINQIIPKL
jgi:hypothetical protein